MSKVMSLKTGFIDLAAALFVIGGVIGLVLSLVAIPINSIYPFTLPENLGFVTTVMLVLGMVCSIGAIHCFTLASKRFLSQAGMRGIIFGALLLTLSLGLVSSSKQLSTQLGVVSAVLVLIAGAICFVLRESVLPRPPMLIRQPVSQHKSIEAY